MKSNPIIVALDVPSPDRALRLVEALSQVIQSFKIGSELFTAAGPDIVRRLRGMGASVFLDLKFHDIPTTVAKAVTAAARLDVQMMTLHASGGAAMLKAAVSAAAEAARDRGIPTPLLLGVTVLTSLTGPELAEVGMEGNVGKQVDRLAALAVDAGLRGLVCSPLELASLRQTLPESMRLITPGIRMDTDAGDDQKRTLTAREAMEAGANGLVIGRPITAASQPRAAAEAILETLRDGRD